MATDKGEGLSSELGLLLHMHNLQLQALIFGTGVIAAGRNAQQRTLKKLHFCCTGWNTKKRTKNTTYELESCRAGLFCQEAISVFLLKGQVHAKEGENMHTKESAFLWEWTKKQKMKHISTYENEPCWAGLRVS